MKRSLSAFALGLTALTMTLSCNEKGNGDDGNTGGQLAPYRDEWRVEAEVPFPYLSGDGTVQIASVRIGGRVYQDNFANRGDVIVEFEEGRDTIKIEMRRFTMAGSRAAAEEDWEALSLWVYNANQTSPKKPEEMDPERQCVGDGGVWQDDCAIRVYYDGQSQLARAGADFRVTLPAAYRHTIRIATEDADDDDDYINRGTVCVNNLRGSAEIELENGVASVIMADDIQAIPICTEAQVEACETYEHEGASAPWHPDCPCIFDTMSAWGSVRVESRDAAAANITIDAPEHLWMNITARNDGPNQSAATSHCNANIELADFIIEDKPFPWSVRGTTPPPSPSASGGYGTIAVSKDCSPVVYTPSPDDYVGRGNGHEQEVEDRGDLRICTNCIRAQSCDQLTDG